MAPATSPPSRAAPTPATRPRARAGFRPGRARPPAPPSDGDPAGTGRPRTAARQPGRRRARPESTKPATDQSRSRTQPPFSAMTVSAALRSSAVASRSSRRTAAKVRGGERPDQCPGRRLRCVIDAVRLQLVVPRVEPEPHALVHGPAGVRGLERYRLAPGGVQAADQVLRDGTAQAPSPVVLRDDDPSDPADLARRRSRLRRRSRGRLPLPRAAEPRARAGRTPGRRFDRASPELARAH